MQIFVVSVVRQDSTHKERPIEYLIDVAGTLTAAMSIQQKTPGSKIIIQNY